MELQRLKFTLEKYKKQREFGNHTAVLTSVDLAEVQGTSRYSEKRRAVIGFNWTMATPKLKRVSQAPAWEEGRGRIILPNTEIWVILLAAHKLEQKSQLSPQTYFSFKFSQRFSLSLSLRWEKSKLTNLLNTCK